MSERISELARRLVVGRKRDGRCVYDAQAKHELIMACREPGVSMARLARECGVNANQLSTWVRRYERQTSQALSQLGDVVEAATPAFVPVRIDAGQPQASEATRVAMRASLPNGVVLDLRECDTQQACQLIQALGRLRCSASTKG